MPPAPRLGSLLCRTHTKFLWVAAKVRRAMTELDVLIANLITEVDHYEGLGGLSAAHIHLAEHASHCFDPTIMCDPSNNAGPTELAEVYDTLHPGLELTVCPDWPWVECR